MSYFKALLIEQPLYLCGLETVRCPGIGKTVPSGNDIRLTRETSLLCALSALVGGMMTVSLRAAHQSLLRVSLAAVRYCLLLMLLAVFGGKGAFKKNCSGPG